jgi:NitT/TauT family transport system substrate-binding protein
LVLGLAPVVLAIWTACAPAPPAATGPSTPAPAAPTAGAKAASGPVQQAAASASPLAATQPGAAATLAPLAQPVEFKFRTQFIPASSYAPYYAAQTLYWPPLGIRAEVLPGVGAAAAVKSVGAGSEQMGIAHFGSVVAGIQEGIPITILAVIARRDPSGLIYLEKSGVKSWKDVEGKTVGQFAAGITGPMIKAGLKSQGVDPERVTFVTVQPGGEVALMASGQLELMANLAGATDGRLRCRGVPAGSLPVYDIGLQVHGEVIFAHNDWLKSVDDEVVARVLLGAFQGFILHKTEPQKAFAEMARLQPNAQIDQVQELMTLHPTGYVNRMLEGGEVVKQYGLGWIDRAEVEKSLTGLVQAELLGRAGDPSQYYTTKYLEHPAVRSAALEWARLPYAPTPPDVRQQCGLS